MLSSSPLVLSSEGAYAFFFNAKETLLLCQKSLKVLHRRSTPSSPCLFAQFTLQGSPASEADSETLLILERSRVVRFALPRMEEISSVPVAAAVSIPDAYVGSLGVDLNPEAGSLRRLLVFDPKERALCYKKTNWKKEPFKFKGVNPAKPVFSASKNFLAFARSSVDTFGDKSDATVVLVPKFEILQAKNYTTVSKKKEIQLLQVHPTEQMAAAADGLGRILLLRYGKEGGKGKVIAQVFHWHSQPVMSLFWSKEGTYLYSGGSERVLIKWNMRENKKEAVAPRLTGPVRNIVGNEHGIITQLGSATLHRFNLEVFTICFTRLEIKDDIAFGDQIFWHRPTSTLASLSNEGKILFYSPREEKCVMELDILETNIVTGEDEKPEKDAEVVPRRLCLAHDGSTLAVYDDNTVRIFEYLENNQKWKQRVVITQPHKGKKISQMTLYKHPEAQNFELVTSGADGATRLWESEAGKWGLRGTITYKQSTPLSHALSADRTVVACAHGETISLWASDLLSLKGTLSSGSGDYTSLEFCSGRKPNLMFAAKAASGVVQIWDLLTLSKILNFETPSPVLRSSALGNVFLANVSGAYRISGDCRISKVHDGKVASALEDDVGRSIIVNSDHSIKYDYSDPVEPGWKSFKKEVESKFAGLSVDKRVKTDAVRRDEAAAVKDFIPRRPLSHKLSEVLEELL